MSSLNIGKQGKIHLFQEDLKNDISKDDGIYKDILKHCPDLFQLLCNLLKDKRTDWHTRLSINAALAYFVVPVDIIPEEKHGVIGYIDDIFLCSYVLDDIRKTVSEKLIIDNWEGKGNVIEIINNVLTKSKRIIREEYSDILKFVGLRTEANLKSNVVSSRIYKMYEEAIRKNMEIFGILSYLVMKIYDIPEDTPHRNLEEIKDFLESGGEMGRIRKIIDIIERNFLRDEE